ncbi:MAG: spore coat protein CotJB [Ruminococcaceae bacterium]|nr:spore coat protein CotJB [Oscillospiraceae bacterium]
MNRRVNNNRTQNSVRNSSNSDQSCEELMRAIMEADFFAQDLKLYLDTHPDDTRAVEMFREAVKQTKACRAAFEDSFYPLLASSAGTDGTWDWADGVWPPFN